MNKVVKILIILAAVVILFVLISSVANKVKKTTEGGTEEQKTSIPYVKCLQYCQQKCPTFDCKTSSGDTAERCPDDADFDPNKILTDEERQCSKLLEKLRNS